MKRSFTAALLCASLGFAAISTATYTLAAEGEKLAAPKGDAAKGQAIVSTVCAACHGADGNSVIPTNPTLAGQHVEYLFKQMKNFKAADGKQPERVSAVMNAMIAPYSEDQMRDLATYFSEQKPKGGTAKDVATVEAGQKLYRAGDLDAGLPACAGCHGPTGAGIPGQFPRIAGQHAEYTEAQLKAFRDEVRENDPNRMMRMVALRMTDKEIKAVADYIAGLH